MSRRVLAAAGAAALLAVALPALPALAAGESGTAKLAAGSDVFPGLSKSLALSVTNTSLMGSVSGIRLTFPSSAVGVKPTLTQPAAPNGFVPTPSTTSNSIFWQKGSLPAGATVVLPFNADVATPAADRSGSFSVVLSQDAGATTFAAVDAGLKTTVRVLEVVTSAAPTAPAGVTDRIATGGQSITQAFSVKNHGSAPLLTAPRLTSGTTSDSVTQPADVTIPAGATVTPTFPVVLGAAPANRTSTFTAAATATGASAPSQTSSITVQQPASIAAGAVAPRDLRPGISSGFTVAANKTASPALKAISGSLTFAPKAGGGFGTKSDLVSPTALADGAPATLTFAQTVVGGDGTADGDNKSYPVSLDFTVTDDNDHRYAIKASPTNNVTLDALAPVVTVLASLPTDADGRRQTAVKNGDVVSFSGTLDNCNDRLDFVRLVPNVGAAAEAKPTPTRSATGQCGFSGTFPAAAFDPAATSFAVTAQASDAASNTGGATTATFIVDTLKPVLDFSQTVARDRILVRFTEANKVYGGCNPTQYKVDGDPLVTRVLYSDGTTCAPGQAGPDNDRILVLSAPKDQDFSTTVEYNPGTRPAQDPAKDDASADAAKAILKTVVGIAPAPPVLVKATRNGGSETAYTDAGNSTTGPTYSTRFVGDDLSLQFTGGRLGYSAEVLNAAGTVVKTVPAGSSPALTPVPLGSVADGAHSFRLRLVNAGGLASAVVPFTVVVDRVNPGLQSVAVKPGVTGATPVEVKFTEFLAAGTDFAFDWTVTQTEAETGENFYGVTKVTATDSTTRTLDTAAPLKATLPASAIYELVADGAKAYEDKAGNRLPTPSRK